MSKIILLGTRKGTLIFQQQNGQWQPKPIMHQGIPVYYAAYLFSAFWNVN
ncbi:hypothetical protein tinsulaeT_00750 [Thalassotalea insulae]|uniref:Uncharacterized protein n=1 Tax=Thalassotalea insulae TaxID=2056778 RepID=A0ABQ6GQM1_9GAMM|nr:hypothetical protein [Thalassotalea insulae]GLX76735.1 hypothetical protein tinsulaeT_00750 [Thalassotalea insulae]